MQKYTTRVERKWQVQFALASIAVCTAFGGPIVIFLPMQLRKIEPADYEILLAVILAAGALVAFVSNIVAGAWSDRTAGKFGRRRPYILIGAVGAAAMLIAISVATTWWIMLILWCLAQMFLNAMLAGMMALLPDLVPIDQRGTMASIFSVAQIVGPVLGGAIAIATAFAGQTFIPWILVAALLVVLPIPLLVGTDDRPLVAEKKLTPKITADELRSAYADFRKNVLKDVDMRRAFSTRFFFQCSITAGSTYLLYYLGETLPSVESQLALTILSAILGLALATTALLAARRANAHEGLQRYVFSAGIVVATGGAILAGVALVEPPIDVAWLTIILAAVILGVGFGLFATNDLVINTRVLPLPQHHGAHLGILNSASSLPQVAGPLVALLTATAFDTYAWPYFAVGILALLGSLSVRKIKLDRQETSAEV